MQANHLQASQSARAKSTIHLCLHGISDKELLITWSVNFGFCRCIIGVLSQINLLFVPLVIQLLWYILKQLFTSVWVKVAARSS